MTVGKGRSDFLIWAPAILLGVFLRIHQLSEQVLLDDEWHGMYFAATRSLSEFNSSEVKSSLWVFMLVSLLQVETTKAIVQQAKICRNTILLLTVASPYERPGLWLVQAN